MTGIDRIKKRILDDAGQKAAGIEEQGQHEAEAVAAEASRKTDRMAAEIIDKACLQAEEDKRRLITAAQLEARKKKLLVKQQLIDSVFDKALEKLRSMPDDRYISVIAGMLLEAVAGMPSSQDTDTPSSQNAGIPYSRNGGVNYEVVLSDADRKRLPGDFEQLVNTRLAARGTGARISVSQETRSFTGGFILKMGDVEANYTFEALIRMQRESLEPEVAKVLF